jgi:anti-sigma regulatory factor (Ser/Thr protein kinase)
MNVMAPIRQAELHRCLVRLTAGPAAAAEARSRVRAAICAWDVPVDSSVAVLLTSELVTNAIVHVASETVTVAITCSDSQLRVDVYDASWSMPVLVDASADAETGRGLMLVATLSDDWGFYRTPAGKAVYFMLALERDPAECGALGPQGSTRGDGEPSAPAGSPSPLNAPAIPAARRLVSGRRPGPGELPGRDGPQGRLTGDICPRMDVELLQDVGNVGRNGSPGQQ